MITFGNLSQNLMKKYPRAFTPLRSRELPKQSEKSAAASKIIGNMPVPSLSENIRKKQKAKGGAQRGA